MAVKTPYPPALPDLTDPTVVSLTVPEAGAFFRLARNTAYLRAADGTWPVIAMGARRLIPAWFVRDALGIQVRDTSAA